MLENKIRKFVLRKGLLPGSPFLFYTWVQYLVILACFIYILVRAIKIPITHDEAGTILNFSTQSVWDIISYKDPIPNNHLLNTLLIKFSTGLFGMNELSCRLPNLVGGVLYLLGSFRLSFLLFRTPVLRLCFLILMIANPFVIEFFALARGYGLSVGFMLVSIYFLLQRKEKNLYTSILLAAIAVYTNLTQLNYLAPLIILVIYLAIKQHFFKSNFILITAGILLLLGVMLAVPVYKMVKTDQFIYWGNTGFWNETFLPLLKSSIQGEGYFSQWTVQIFIALICFSVFFTIIKSWHGWSSKKDNFSDALLLNCIFFGALLYNIMQHYLFNIPFLNARTSIFFYPLFVLALSSSIAEVGTIYYKKPLYVFYILTASFGLVHISRTYNLHSAFEWWYDGDNKKVINRLIDSDVSKPVRLKCNWIFQPSLTFYTKGMNQKLIMPPPYVKTIDTSELADYYYITSDDLNDWFRKNYNIDTSFAWNTRYLMKKK